jgi:hypothetical protein
MRLQLIRELASHTAPLRRVGSIYTVGEFRHGQRTDHDSHVPGSFADSPDRLGRSEFSPLGRDQYARIEN